jgi:group I intron endonuclease
MKNSISGIYQIRNIINNHKYIGSAVNIGSRWSLHKHHLKNNKHHNRYLQRAWNKYGADCFEFTIIETCFSFALLIREQHYLDKLKPEYNIEKKAGSSLGVKRTPEYINNMKNRVISKETRLRMSEARKKLLTPEFRKEMSDVRKGYKHSPGTLINLSIAAKKRTTPEIIAMLLSKAIGNKHNLGRKVSLETRKKMSDSHKNVSNESRVKMSISAIEAWKKRKK